MRGPRTGRARTARSRTDPQRRLLSAPKLRGARQLPLPIQMASPPPVPSRITRFIRPRPLDVPLTYEERGQGGGRWRYS